MTRFAVVCFAFLWLNVSQADSWMPPHQFDTPSENGKFVAHVTPAKDNSSAMLTVSGIYTGRTNELWHTDLSNKTAPSVVLVSNNGGSVVTLDNWGGLGYGDDVVAIYNESGQFAKYSLEQIAPPPKPKPDTPEWLSDRYVYQGKFSHSTSSRHWREKSIEFFFRDGDSLLFCLWLDWESRWAVWRMGDGKMIKISSKQAQSLDIEGRRRSLEEVKSGDFASASLNFLGRLHFKEDRPLIEAWLRDGEFSGGSVQSYSSEHTNPSFAFTARSYKRETADKILAQWDGKNAGDSELGSLDHYVFLGTLKCTVSFTSAPAKGEGTIRLYLVPDSTPFNEWASARPAQYLIADLNQSYPYLLGGSRGRDGSLSNRVSFIIYGVTPGRYRLKAVWDKAAPLAKGNEIVFQLGSGDYESTTSPLISIRKGAVTASAHIECTKLVK